MVFLFFDDDGGRCPPRLHEDHQGWSSAHLSPVPLRPCAHVPPSGADAAAVSVRPGIAIEDRWLGVALNVASNLHAPAAS